MPILLALLAVLAIACGGSKDDALIDAFPTPLPEEVALGREVGDVYGQMLFDVQVIVEPRPPAPEAKERLRLLRNEYKVYFASYGCQRKAMSASGQAEAERIANEKRDEYGSENLSILEDAASDYDYEDTSISVLLHDIASLDDYVYLERIETTRPGEVVQCGS